MVYEERDTGRLPVARSAATTPPPPAGAESAPARKLTFLRELTETVLLTLIIFVAVRNLVVNYRVDGESMYPNLHNGQYLLVNKAVYFHFDLNAARNLLPGQHRQGEDVVYLFHTPERGDIIVLDPPNVHSDKPYIKRVIALPGETVAVRGDKVYVNGQPLAEPYIADPPHYPYPYAGGEFVVPEGTVFVMGDNRNNSSDSHIFGPVPLDNVIGKAFFSYLPLRDAGLIPHERYAKAQAGQ